MPKRIRRCSFDRKQNAYRGSKGGLYTLSESKKKVYCDEARPGQSIKIKSRKSSKTSKTKIKAKAGSATVAAKPKDVVKRASRTTTATTTTNSKYTTEELKRFRRIRNAPSEFDDDDNRDFAYIECAHLGSRKFCIVYFDKPLPIRSTEINIKNWQGSKQKIAFKETSDGWFPITGDFEENDEGGEWNTGKMSNWFKVFVDTFKFAPKSILARFGYWEQVRASARLGGESSFWKDKQFLPLLDYALNKKFVNGAFANDRSFPMFKYTAARSRKMNNTYQLRMWIEQSDAFRVPL